MRIPIYNKSQNIEDDILIQIEDFINILYKENGYYWYEGKAVFSPELAKFLWKENTNFLASWEWPWNDWSDQHSYKIECNWEEKFSWENDTTPRPNDFFEGFGIEQIVDFIFVQEGNL